MDGTQVFLEAWPWAGFIGGVVSSAIGVLQAAYMPKGPLGQNLGGVIAWTIACAAVVAIMRAVRLGTAAIVESIETARPPAAAAPPPIPTARPARAAAEPRKGT